MEYRVLHMGVQSPLSTDTISPIVRNPGLEYLHNRNPAHAYTLHIENMYTEYTPDSLRYTMQNTRNEKIKRIGGYRKVTDDTDIYETRMTHGGQYITDNR